MKKVNITLTFDDDKLDALEFSLRKEHSSVQARMGDALKQLYEQTVPEAVREYLDSNVTPGMRFCKRDIRRICSRGSRKPIMVSVKCTLCQRATMRSSLQRYLNELKSYGKNAV